MIISIKNKNCQILIEKILFQDAKDIYICPDFYSLFPQFLGNMCLVIKLMVLQYINFNQRIFSEKCCSRTPRAYIYAPFQTQILKFYSGKAVLYLRKRVAMLNSSHGKNSPLGRQGHMSIYIYIHMVIYGKTN